MKRIMMATVVLCLAAALQMMGQTKFTPATQPTTKTTTQPTTDTTSDSAAKKLEQDRTERSMNSLSQGTASGKGSARAENTTSTTPGGAVGAQGSVGDLKCRGLERRPCTEEKVRDLARRMGEKSAEHPVLAEINTLRLDSPDGTLSCRQNNGNRCTAEQVRSLNEHVAAEMRCEIRFEDSRSSAGNATDPYPNKASDIAAKVEAWERSLSTTNTTSDSAANGQVPEGTLNTTDTTSDSAAKELERERTERRMNATAEIVAKELERERAERRMNATAEIAAKELERERAERRMNALSQGTARGQGSTGAKNTTSATPSGAAGGQGSVEPKTQPTKPPISPPKSGKGPNRG